MASKRRYLWPKARLLELDSALALVQSHTKATVSLVSPLADNSYAHDAYRDTVFFWLPDQHAGIVWKAEMARFVAGDVAKRIASQLDYAVWRRDNPERDCLDCHQPFLPAQGWDEAGYPHDVCPGCVARRLALLGPDQVLGTPYDPRAVFQRASAQASIDDLDGPIDSL